MEEYKNDVSKRKLEKLEGVKSALSSSRPKELIQSGVIIIVCLIGIFHMGRKSVGLYLASNFGHESRAIVSKVSKFHPIKSAGHRVRLKVLDESYGILYVAPNFRTRYQVGSEVSFLEYQFAGDNYLAPIEDEERMIDIFGLGALGAMLLLIVIGRQELKAYRSRKNS